MKIIAIPFEIRFTEAMERGIKIRTWRTRRYGKPGDIFHNGQSDYRIMRVEQACMGSVPKYFKQEGFESKVDAIKTLMEIFSANGYQPGRIGWAHWFEKVKT